MKTVSSTETLPPPPADRHGWPWSATRRAESAEVAKAELPRITIVTPSYGQAQFLEQTLRSVLLQGYPNLEYLVFDGGSRDGSLEILERYSEHLTYWQSEPDRGQAHAINMGLGRASGEILGWLNSDDLLLPGALHRVAGLFREQPKAAAWVGACYRVDASGRLLSVVRARGLAAESIADWSGKGFFYQPSCFFSAAAWSTTGPLDQELRYAFDLDLWIRLAEVGPFAATEDVLSAAVIHDDAKTQAERAGMHAETAAVQVRHGYLESAAARLERLLSRESARATPFERLRSTLGRLTARARGTRRRQKVTRYPLRDL